MNKLAAIFTVWGECDLLPYMIDNVLPVVDEVIVVYSNCSNYGNIQEFSCKKIVTYLHWEPKPGLHPHQNETDKRNFGLQKAKEAGFTHFLMMDEDEAYNRKELSAERDRVYNDGINGVVHRLKVYFKKPTLVCDDHTLVAGITKLNNDTQVGNFKTFPFAYDSAGHAHIDPTRRPNHTEKIVMSPFYMHHYSWVRKDFDQKINNSSARTNLQRSSIYKDLANAAPNVYNEFYRQELKECPNNFNLPLWENS